MCAGIAAFPDNRAMKKNLKRSSDNQLTFVQAMELVRTHWNAAQYQQVESLCRKILAVQPNHAEALHFLGLVAHQSGHIDAAHDLLRRACQVQPDPVFLSNFAEICRLKKSMDEGEKAARRALVAAPQMASAWNNLGIILQETGRYEEALTCLNRVAKSKPRAPEVWNNLGNTHRKMGYLDKAKDCYSKALAFAPNYPEAHSNLANCLKEEGQFGQAETEARLAIRLNPRLLDAYLNLSAIASVQNKDEAALQIIDVLLSIEPSHLLGLNAKAGILISLERHQEAMEIARRTVELAPENGDGVVTLGQALLLSGEHELALAAFERAANLPTTEPGAGLMNKGLLLTEINRTEEAREIFHQVLKIDPNSTKAIFNLVEAQKIQQSDPLVARMEEILARNGAQAFNDRMGLHFALGKAWMDIGDGERAFAYLDKGNRMKRSTVNYNSDAMRQWLEDVCAAFSPQLFEKWRGGGHNSELPVFVIGMPRSGTTLIEQILSAHPDIWGAGELSCLQKIVSGRQGTISEWIVDLKQGDLEGIGRDYMDRISGLAHGRRRLVDKMPANFFYAGLIALCLPQARIIHCMRDPADTCLSCYTKLFQGEQSFSYDQKELGEFYRSYAVMMEHWRNVLPSERFIEVKYEAVVADMEHEARRLIDFCGLEWDENCLSFHKNNRPVRTASLHQVRQPLYSASIGRWKKWAPHLEPLLQALGGNTQTPDAFSDLPRSARAAG